MDQLLEEVKRFAAAAHGAQRRKFADEPYIVHPIRVMEHCKRFTQSMPILAAALLHDVLEDTPLHSTEIRNFLSPLVAAPEVNTIISLVKELTDIYTKDRYPDWNRRKRKSMETVRLTAISAEAQTIKYADILDNCDIAEADTDFAPIYLQESASLLSKLTKGHPQLRQEAIDLVNESLKKIKKR